MRATAMRRANERGLQMLLALALLLVVSCGEATTTAPPEDGASRLATTVPLPEAFDVRSEPFRPEWVGGTLVVCGYPSPPATMNQLLATTSDYRAYFLHLLAPPLLQYAPDYVDGIATVEPKTLATMPESEDLQTWTFTLREDLTWSGPEAHPVTTEDVRFSFDMMRAPESGAAALAANFEDVAALTVVDARRFTVRYKEPRSDGGLHFGLNFRIVPAKTMPADPQAFAATKRHASYGAYELVDQTEQRCVIALRPEYRKAPHPHGPQYVERLEFPFIADLAQREAEFLEGRTDVHLLGSGLARRAPLLAAEGVRARPINYLLPLYFLIAWNTAVGADADQPHPLLGDARVRRALDHFVPRAELSELLFAGEARPISGPYSEADPAAHPAIPAPKYDPEAGQAALSAAGFARGEDGRWRRDGQELAFTLTSYASGWMPEAAQKIADRMRPHGIEVTVDLVPGQEFVPLVNRRDYEAAVFMNSISRPSEEDLHAILHSRLARADSANWAMLKDAECDRLTEEILAASDPKVRTALRRELLERVLEITPYSFLLRVPTGLLVHERWANAQAHDLGLRYQDLILAERLRAHPPTGGR